MIGIGGSRLNVLDYIINLSIFSLLVSAPLVVRTFISYSMPIKYVRILFSFYAGIVSIILVLLSFQQNGYSYDIRYAAVILAFAYLGPVPGLITGIFSLLARLTTSGQWFPAIAGWLVIIIVFCILHVYITRLSAIKKIAILVISYMVIYIVTVPVIFNAFRDSPLFHIQYLLFVLLGVIIGGLLIESYLKLYRIISEKKQMEQSLEESEAKYRLIAENTSDLIMLMNKNNSISYLSPSHELVLGYYFSELNCVELYSFIHPDDVEVFKNNINKMFSTKQSYSIEFRIQHKKGDWLYMESRCMPVKGENDSIEHIVIISRDISERKKSEEILLQSEKLSIVGELAAGVAHEIRNPLTTIKGFIQLYKKENRMIEYNDLILSELERIEIITSELLSLGKPQAVQFNRINIEELIQSTIEFLAPQALLNKIQFELECKELNLQVFGEKNQLKQVLLNIIKNAMEAMASGGVITIGVQKTLDGECLLTIKDQGHGIPEEILPRLGEPFYSLKEKGTGLGLMICHKIIKQHNGKITYKSKVNEGTVIGITLPISS